MSTLETKIKSDLTQAMKDQNKVKTLTLRNVLKAISDVKTLAENAIKDPTDKDIQEIIKKMVKDNKKAISTYRENGRNDLADSEQAEVDVLLEYIPKMMSESDTKDLVAKIIADLGVTSVKEMGKVMGMISKTYGDKIDKSLASGIVKSMLS